MVFWLDFQGWGPAKCRKKMNKQLLGNHSFLSADKSGSKFIFIDFLIIRGLHFGPPRRPKIKEFMISLRLSVRRAPWIVLGPLLLHFGTILGSCWSHFWWIFEDVRCCFRCVLKVGLVLPVLVDPFCSYHRKLGENEKGNGKGKENGKGKGKGKGKGRGTRKGKCKGKGRGKEREQEQGDRDRDRDRDTDRDRDRDRDRERQRERARERLRERNKEREREKGKEKA